MTPLEVALTCLTGYLGTGLAYAREHFRRVHWELDDDNMNAVASLGAGLIWPLVVLVLGAMLLIKAPGRIERRKVKHDRLEANIARLERELQMTGHPDWNPGGRYWRGS